MVSESLRRYAGDAADRAGIPRGMFVRQIEVESGFDPGAVNAVSGARGVAQIVARFHPGVDPDDPHASLDYAARWMAQLRRQYGSYRVALAAYNWGPGHVSGYTEDGIVTPPWDGRRESLPAETRRYLDAILGEGWPEPPVPQPAQIGRPAPLVVAEHGVRLRQGPGTDSAILATLAAGTEAVPLADHAWRHVNVNGVAGWIAVQYLASALPTVQGEHTDTAHPSIRRFDPDTPTYYQRLNWTCSVASVVWLLRSIGIDVAPEEAHDAMVPAHVDGRGEAGVGLLDASGAGIVEVLRECWGVRATSYPSVTWAQVTA